MAAITTVGSSGDDDIDGVLSGYRWASGALTYSFTTSSAQYSYSVPGFQALNGAQQAAVEAAFANYAAVANLSFTEVGGGTGTLRFAEADDPGTAYAYLPHPSEAGGDAFFNHYDYNTPDKGSYSYLTFVHEIGHTLGLDHGQDGNAALPTDHDSLEYSVMTYRSYVGADLSGYTTFEGSYPLTLMLADIAALQYMYGANYATNAGDSTYRWSPTTGELEINGVSQGRSTTNTIFMTVWDGGGTDTYDFSSYTSDLEVNLTPGEWTTTSSAQRAVLGFGEYARGNIANAWLYQNDTASLIENAVGGSGDDFIVGNQAANDLKGGSGDDSLKGLAGDDTIWGGSGDDICLFTVASTACTVTYDGSAQAYLVTTAGGGTDTLRQIEFFGFTDKIVAAGVITPEAPVLIASTPDDDAKGVSDSANIVLTFSEHVVAGDGRIVIRQSSGTVFESFDVGSDPDGISISGDIVTIDPAGHFKAGTSYYLTIEAGAFEDLDGNPFSGIADATALDFSVEAGIARGTGRSERIGGTNQDDRIYARGGDDSVIGKSGDDFINGGRGVDNLAGGRGDDTYRVNTAHDKVVEAASQGTDLVKSSASYALAANVENLRLTGRGNIDGTGNSGVNTISGNSGRNELAGKGGKDGLDGGGGRDRLYGGSGHDTLDGGDGRDWLDGGRGHDVLTGGNGQDTFVFSVKAKQRHADTITDFDSDNDTIVLSHKVFKALSTGVLLDADAAYATDADAASAHIVYDRPTGELFYDKDGSGDAGDVRIATLAAGLTFAADDFLIV